jgi:fatty acid desaturase
MLLAPFTLTEPATRRVASEARRSDAIPTWLLAWAVLGGIALLCIPALRGGPATGLTLPFWLVAAPLLNILWLTRRRWMAQFGLIARHR